MPENASESEEEVDGDCLEVSSFGVVAVELTSGATVEDPPTLPLSF